MINLAIMLRPKASAPKKYMILCSKENGAKFLKRKFILVYELLVREGPKIAINKIKIRNIIEIKASLSFKNIDITLLNFSENVLLL